MSRTVSSQEKSNALNKVPPPPPILHFSGRGACLTSVEDWEIYFDADFFLDDLFAGTLPPALRASDSPIAIACFLLVTFLPELLFNVPFLRSRIVFSTFSDAFLPYLATVALLGVWATLTGSKHRSHRVTSCTWADTAEP